MGKFSFAKIGTLPDHGAAVGGNGPFWPSVVDVRWITTGDLASVDYAIYYSSDHANDGNQGIFLLTCAAGSDPTLLASWQTYGAGRIFEDATQGSQTETPCVQRVGDLLYMTYHNDGSGNEQSTLLATSPDGTSWTRINGAEDSVILDYDPAVWPGDGHTGYFNWAVNPFTSLGWTYVGYSLHGGGLNNGGGYAQWGSDDAITWTRISILDQLYSPALGLPADQIFAWNGIDPTSFRVVGDEVFGLGRVREPGSGGSADPGSVVEIAMDAASGQRLTRQPTTVVSTGGSGADDEITTDLPSSITLDDGSVLLAYRGFNSAGDSSIMLAAGSFDASANGATKLSRPTYESVYQVDFKSASALPFWLESASSGASAVTLSSSGLALEIANSGEFAQVRTVFSVESEQWDEISIVAKGIRATGPQGGAVGTFIGNSSNPLDPDDGVAGTAFSSVSFEVRLRSRSGSNNVTVEDTDQQVSSDGEERLSIRDWGLRWNLLAERIELLQHPDGKAVSAYADISGDLAPSSIASQLSFAAKDAPYLMEGLVIRFGTSSHKPVRAVSASRPFTKTVRVRFNVTPSAVTTDAFTIAGNSTTSVSVSGSVVDITFADKVSSGDVIQIEGVTDASGNAMLPQQLEVAAGLMPIAGVDGARLNSTGARGGG